MGPTSIWICLPSARLGQNYETFTQQAVSARSCCCSSLSDGRLRHTQHQAPRGMSALSVPWIEVPAGHTRHGPSDFSLLSPVCSSCSLSVGLFPGPKLARISTCWERSPLTPAGATLSSAASLFEGSFHTCYLRSHPSGSFPSSLPPGSQPQLHNDSARQSHPQPIVLKPSGWISTALSSQRAFGAQGPLK